METYDIPELPPRKPGALVPCTLTSPTWLTRFSMSGRRCSALSSVLGSSLDEDVVDPNPSMLFLLLPPRANVPPSAPLPLLRRLPSPPPPPPPPPPPSDGLQLSFLLLPAAPPPRAPSLPPPSPELPFPPTAIPISRSKNCTRFSSQST